MEIVGQREMGNASAKTERDVSRPLTPDPRPIS
jgi:hypothetical protein